MTDQHAELDAALERVIDGRPRAPGRGQGRRGPRSTTTTSGRRTSTLNNASFAYDEQLLDAFGEVTPWDVESIDPDEADQRFGVGLGGVDGDEPTDPHPQVISVRQRRDYRVPSVAALIRVAEAARRDGRAGGRGRRAGRDGRRGGAGAAAGRRRVARRAGHPGAGAARRRGHGQRGGASRSTWRRSTTTTAPARSRRAPTTSWSAGSTSTRSCRPTTRTTSERPR